MATLEILTRTCGRPWVWSHVPAAPRISRQKKARTLHLLGTASEASGRQVDLPVEATLVDSQVITSGTDPMFKFGQTGVDPVRPPVHARPEPYCSQAVDPMSWQCQAQWGNVNAFATQQWCNGRATRQQLLVVGGQELISKLVARKHRQMGLQNTTTERGDH